MTQRTHHLFRLSLLVIITMFLSLACVNFFTQDFPTQKELSSSTDCQTIKHDAGTMRFCGQPQQIAALSPYVLDIMLSLGVQPAGYAENKAVNLQRFDDPRQQIPYLGSKVTTQPINLGANTNPSLEALTLLKPDLILGNLWQRDQYNLLAQIAPTLLIDHKQGDWQRSLQMLAKALGREEEAQHAIAMYQQQVAEARTKLAPVVAAHPRMLVITSGKLTDFILLESYSSPVSDLLEALGFQLVLLEGDQQRNTKLRPQISIETLAQLDADIIIAQTWSNTLYEPLTNFKNEWHQTPLLRNMQTYQEGRVYFVDYRLWAPSSHGPIAAELILEEISNLLLSP